MAKATIRVTAINDASKPTDFKFERIFPGEEDVVKENGDFDFKSNPKKNKKFNIVFELVDNTSPLISLKFIRPKEDVFLTSRSGCPQPGEHEGCFGIEGVEDYKLKVVNRNCEDAQFKYALNFTSSIGPRQCDPVVINGGGGGNELQLHYIALIVAAVGGGIVTLLGAKLIRYLL